MAAGGSRLRLVLALNAFAVATISLVFLAALAAPFARALPPVHRALLLLALVVHAVLVLGLITALTTRAVARPVDRLFAAADRLAREGELPVLGDAGSLASAAVAFERVAGALAEERGRLAAKVDELTHANRDLAEARESLVRSEKLATVGRLAAGVAHEVGNPLGAITGYVELARDRLNKGDAAAVADYLARVAAEVERIDRTVRELLDFSRPAKPALSPIDLAAALDASLRLARVQTRFKQVEVEAALAPGLPPVLADEHHLAQVLVNLFLNAGDAMAGEGKLTVSARPLEPRRATDGGGERVLVVVADTGPGIAPDDLPRIFDPFFTTKDPGKGTGLGLAICHRIMESFGGEITAGNRVEGGAEFHLVLRAAGRSGAAGAC